jgi:integrase
MMGHAVEWGYLSRNPALGVKRPRVQGGLEEMRVLTREQLERLVEHARPEAQLGIRTAAFTGLRRGELFALRWSDVDGPRRRLWVRRSVTRDGEFQQPKARRSVRAVAIPDSLVRQLLEHRMASRFKGDDELVFPNERGGPVDAGNFVRREFKTALRRANLPEIRWHDLRHTFASLLIAAGEHPKLVSEQLGHSSTAITMDRYGHLFDQSYGDASDRLETVLYGPAAASVLPAPASAQASPPAASTQGGRRRSA